MAEKKSNFIVFIIMFGVLLIGGGLYGLKAYDNQATEMVNDIIAESAGETSEERQLQTQEKEALPFDIEAASKERILGDPNAPIKVSEHSSFSCGHCGNFHRNIYPQFKAEWIDTGKAYLVFSDFPLNAPALVATLSSRCVADDDAYFNLVAALFAQQDDWAYDSAFAVKLQAITADFGLDKATFDSCANNQELQERILNKMRASQQQFGVDSTPSFVVNNAVAISGGRDYAEFKASLEAALAEIENQ